MFRLFCSCILILFLLPISVGAQDLPKVDIGRALASSVIPEHRIVFDGAQWTLNGKTLKFEKQRVLEAFTSLEKKELRSYAVALELDMGLDIAKIAQLVTWLRLLGVETLLFKVAGGFDTAYEIYLPMDLAPQALLFQAYKHSKVSYNKALEPSDSISEATLRAHWGRWLGVPNRTSVLKIIPGGIFNFEGQQSDAMLLESFIQSALQYNHKQAVLTWTYLEFEKGATFNDFAQIWAGVLKGVRSARDEYAFEYKGDAYDELSTVGKATVRKELPNYILLLEDEEKAFLKQSILEKKAVFSKF
jgi:hypothetical protein